MSDNDTPQDPQQRQIQVRETGIATHYANFFTITGGREALLLTFGTQFTRPDAVQVENKVVLSPVNAKRLAVSLGQVIRRYESEHGEIDLNVRPPQQTPPPSDAE